MDPPPATAVTTTTTGVAANSVDSSPRSKNTSESVPKLRLMCSFGGHIVPRPHDKSLCYIGGDTRIVVVDRHSSLSDIIHRLSKTLLNSKHHNFTLKYQLPTEDLDSLISVTTDEDLENMIDEYDRLNNNSTGKLSRLRLFLFPMKIESISSFGSLLENSIKSEDWFLNALNGTNNSGGLSNSNSVNSLLGLNDDVLVVNNPKVVSVGVSKNQDMHSVPDSLDRTSSFGSASSAPSLGNLAPIRVQVQEDQQHKPEGVNGNGNQKSDDGGFVAMSSPSAAVKVGAVPLSSAQVVGDYSGLVLSDDERSEHGATAYRKQLQQQAQLMTSQSNQKPSGGGRDLASPDSASSDGSITNPLSRQKPMMYQDPNIQYSSVQSRVATNPVEQKITDSRIQMQQQYQDSGYLLPTQFDPQHHPQLHQQQPQFIHAGPAGSQYIQHLPVGAVPMPSYYPVYSSQQSQHSHIPGLEQQYPVYYVPARQTQAYNMPMQHMDYGEAAGAAPSSRPQTATSAAMVPPSGQYNITRNATAPKSEVPTSLYRTANTAAASVVQIASGQPRPQYVGYSQVHHPQSSNPTSGTTSSYTYEVADPTQQAHVYYAQPQMAAQYQTMTSASSEAAAQLPADSIKQQVRTSQP